MSTSSSLSARPQAASSSPRITRQGSSQNITINSRPTRPRKSSILGADPRGDTGATSFATSDFHHQSPPGTPASPTNHKSFAAGNGKPTRERKRRKARKLFNRWKRMSLKHTWVNPLILVLLVLAGYYVNPSDQNPLHSAIFLSYPNPPIHERTDTLPAHVGHVTQFGKGRKDFAFVVFYTIVLSFTREFLMQRMIRPIAIRCGITSRAKQSRFMEQFYTAMYFAIFGPYGLYVMSRTPVWYFNTTGMYEGFPHRAHEACFKAYYLLQGAYWAQQGLVLLLQLEKPRKDFKELVLHHLITLSLIALSYRFHFTYMGLAVYITHDVSDFFLATSKLLNYIDSRFTGPYFVFFICVWAYLRHYINLGILHSLIPANALLPNAGEFTRVGPFDLNWETQQYKCRLAQVITFGLLATLQAVNIFWFVLIVRVLYRIVFKGVQKDERSDDEEEEQVPVTKLQNPKPPARPEVRINGQPMDFSVSVRTGIDGPAVKNVASRKR